MFDYDVFRFGYTQDQIRQLCKGLNDYLRSQGLGVAPCTNGQWFCYRDWNHEGYVFNENYVTKYFDDPYDAVMMAFQWIKELAELQVEATHA